MTFAVEDSQTLKRIASALERIADALEKLADPPKVEIAEAVHPLPLGPQGVTGARCTFQFADNRWCALRAGHLEDHRRTLAPGWGNR